MDHFVQNHHSVPGLNDLLQIVVQHREGGWSRTRAETQQAALGIGAKFRIVIRAGADVVVNPPGIAAVGPVQSGAGGGTFGCFWSQLRHATVGRVNDDGGPPLAFYFECAGAVVDPERVVAADIAGGAFRAIATSRRRGAVGIAGLIASGFLVGRGFGQDVSFGIGQRSATAYVCRADERCERGDVEGSGEIGVAVRCAGTLGVHHGSDQQGSRQDQIGHLLSYFQHRCFTPAPERKHSAGDCSERGFA